MKNTSYIFIASSILILFLFSLNSCFYDKLDILQGEYTCDSTSYSYSMTIQPIISVNCIGCHDQNNASGGILLDSYTAVKEQADNGNLLGVIRHENGYNPMPKDRPQLSPCNILKIELWVADGAPND